MGMALLRGPNVDGTRGVCTDDSNVSLISLRMFSYEDYEHGLWRDDVGRATHQLAVRRVLWPVLGMRGTVGV